MILKLLIIRDVLVKFLERRDERRGGRFGNYILLLIY